MVLNYIWIFFLSRLLSLPYLSWFSTGIRKYSGNDEIDIRYVEDRIRDFLRIDGRPDVMDGNYEGRREGGSCRSYVAFDPSVFRRLFRNYLPTVLLTDRS